MEVEVCVEKLETALLADKYGAARIELCSALDLGGLTPSMGLTKACVNNCNLKVYVMIRPRQGGFVYNSAELDTMADDIKLAASFGAHGVVFGCLTKNFEVDLAKNERLMSMANTLNLGVTFHRAFDFVKDVDVALEQIIDLGFERILTSGGAKIAPEGIDKINGLAAKSSGRIDIMAGSGINAQNCIDFEGRGISAIHFTARKAIANDDTLNMGIEYIPDKSKIKEILKHFS